MQTKKAGQRKNFAIYSFKGFFIGVINGLLGAGGGMLAVPLMTKSGVNQTQAHATSVAVIFPLSLFSAFLYLHAGRVQLADVYGYLPWGICGAIIGAYMLPKIPRAMLRRVFALITAIAGFRLLLR